MGGWWAWGEDHEWEWMVRKRVWRRAERAYISSAKMSGRAIASLVWGFATAERPAAAMLDAVAPHAVAKLRSLAPGPLSALALGYATAADPTAVEKGTKQVLSAIGDEVRGNAPGARLRAFPPRHLNALARAYALASARRGAGKGEAWEGPLGDIAAAGAARLGDFSDRELALLPWAYGRAGVGAPELFDALVGEVPARILSASDLLSIVWSFSTLRHVDGHAMPARKMLGALREELAARRDGFTELQQTTIAQAYEGIGAQPPFAPPERAEPEALPFTRSVAAPDF